MARIGFAERLAQHRRAVLALAHQSAKRAVKRQFQAQGVKLHDLTARQITIWAEAWFDAHSADRRGQAQHRYVARICTLARALRTCLQNR